ncbi:MAG: ATP-binding cassette domain-containing protein, partial [Lachnospiraceae bacterium]|nr:ATP-binding cassette domain-containing protein [Lachnospiraceae bacterium]
MSKYDYDLPFVEEDDDIVVLKHLTKHFPVKTSLSGKVLVSVKAVNDVSLRIKKGTTLGVVGESGCGKTTMGRTMLRLYDITSGEVVY